MDELKSVNQQLRKKVYELQNLVEISFQLNSMLDEQQIMHNYSRNVFGMLGSRSLVILSSTSPYAKTFVPVYFRGLEKAQAKTLGIRKSEPLVRGFKRKPETRQVRGLDTAEVADDYLKALKRAGISVIAPIAHRQALLGLVLLGKKHNAGRYSRGERELFSLLTNLFAVAFANARLYGQMERMSLTDPLTGLFNRRYFENYLHSEVARAKRFNHPISLVMLDVDHFKHFNDQLGHTNGDQLLKELADLLTRTVRCSDVVARYGGEEFCVILPEISTEGAVSFSERLRHAVYQHPFDKREVQPEGHVTISLGAATFPSDAQVTNELVEKADFALYRAKNRGRNQVAVYSNDARLNLPLQIQGR
ncbi:MAG: GGDEF domain-containing protein [Calditrichaeota bacterium]|nr:MAG: GGDEF domain-containing protein [Calditrichota bacterium]